MKTQFIRRSFTCLTKLQRSWSAGGTRMKLATTILFQFLTIPLLFAQVPSTPIQPDSGIAKFSPDPDLSGPEANAYANTNFTYKIIDAPNNTFCYDVFADGRLMLHQSSVPGLPGNEGFKTKADAEKVALLVIDKIKKGEMPPTVSIDEMKKLNVIPLR